MTIDKGQAWGRPMGEDLDLLAVETDDALAALADEARRRGEAPTVALTGGDLLATLGLSGPRPLGERHAYPIDLGLATLDSAPIPLPFVAHLTVRPRPTVAARLATAIGDGLGHGPPLEVVLMNGAWHGELRLGPKAHPNDGLLDIVEGRVGFSDRHEANRRARSGSHLPHPSLRSARARTWRANFDEPKSIWLDGIERGTATTITVELLPDALTVVA